MEQGDIFDSLKRTFSRNNFLRVFFTSLLSFIIIILISAGLVWHYRAKIFGYFAKEYLQEAKVMEANTKGSVPGDTQIATEQILGVNPPPTQDSLVVDA